MSATNFREKYPPKLEISLDLSNFSKVVSQITDQKT